MVPPLIPMNQMLHGVLEIGFYCAGYAVFDLKCHPSSGVQLSAGNVTLELAAIEPRLPEEWLTERDHYQICVSQRGPFMISRQCADIFFSSANSPLYSCSHGSRQSWLRELYHCSSERILLNYIVAYRGCNLPSSLNSVLASEYKILNTEPYAHRYNGLSVFYESRNTQTKQAGSTRP